MTKAATGMSSSQRLQPPSPRGRLVVSRALGFWYGVNVGGVVAIAEEDLLDSRGFLSDIGVWPEPTRLELVDWLSNFENGDDREVAAALLESFVHLNEAQVRHATISGFVSLSGRPEFGAPDDRQRNWDDFLSRAYVSYPSGSATDAVGSGQIFARIAGREAGFDDRRILGPDDLVTRIVRKGITCPVVFLDDLSGTGNQFNKTWGRKVATGNGSFSLEDLAKSGAIESAYYVPVAATAVAISAILTAAPFVSLAPVYVLDVEYSAAAPGNRLVPAQLAARIQPFVEKYAPLTGVKGSAFGYGDSGLALSFHHSTPNNTLPVLQKATNATPPEWKALIA